MEYNSEQLNYFRMCYIAFNLVPEGLRKVFRQEWDFRYKTTTHGEWKETPQNGRDFYSNETSRSRKKNARFLARIQNGNTAEWDCSCLFFAILYSDSIGTTLSPAVGKEVDDLRKVRNDIAHINEAELTDVEFQNCVAKVLTAFNSLKLSVIAADVEAVKNQTNFPTADLRSLEMQADNLKAEVKTKEEENEALTQEINYKVKSVCSLTFKPSHELIRRSTDVTRTVKKIQDLENKSKGAVSTIYLSGIPGCGKSQIARQVGQEFFDKKCCESKGLTLVATLNAETLETLADSYITLGRQVGMTEYTLTNLATSKVDSPKETIQHLTRLILPKMKQFCNWLIIADNVVDLPLVHSNLPPTASEEWGNGQVLITTQDSNSIPSNAPHSYHESLSEGMQPDDAVELLKQVSQIPNQDQAEKVAEVLDYQPLALAAAAFYVQEVVTSGSPNFSWTNYLEALRRGEREATEEPLAQQNFAYSKTMTTAVKMAVDRASESDEVLRQAFYLFSLCAPISLPIEAAVNFVKFLAAGQTEESIKARILKSSLITCSYDEDGVPAYLRMHNIVHDVLKSILMSVVEFTNRFQLLSVAIKIFHSLLEKNKKLLFASGHVCVKLRTVMTHCKVLHEILSTNFEATKMVMKEFTHLITPADVVSWLCSTAEVCCHLSNPADANIFSSTALEFVMDINGTRDGELLKADVFNVHGDVTSLHCEYESSLSYYEEARTIKIAIYGEDQANVAVSHTKLGNAYWTLGQYSRAKEHHKKAMVINKKIYGEHHTKVAVNYSNLGNVYSDLGRYSEAKEHHEKALIIRKKVYGEQHAKVAASYNNLGTVYFSLGQYKEAKEHHEKALTIRKKIYGEQHADVALSYNNLGTVYSGLGQYNQAKEHHEKALIITKKIYSERHADVAGSYNNLGAVHSKIGQHTQAKEYHEKALIIRKQIYGEQHADVAASYNNLGNVFRKLGQHCEAKEHHEKVLIIRKKVHGEQHSLVAASYNNLGNVYHDLGQYSEAKEHYERALIIRKKVYGEQHAQVGHSYNNLGNVYSDLKQYVLAKECLEKALNIYKAVYGEKHAAVERSYRNLTLVDRNLRQATNKCCIT